MLTKFKLVRTEGLKGLMVKGRFIPFEKIDDTLAEQLIGKTHVLERVAEAPASPTELATGAEEAGTGTRSRRATT